MKYVSYFDCYEACGRQKQSGVAQLIIAVRDFSRFGRVRLNELNDLVAILKNDFELIFEWDILMTDSVFHKKAELLSAVDLSNFKAIRVQDPGAIEYCMQNFSIPIQFIAETGNRNIIGLKKWVDYIGNRLDRIVLSTEIPSLKLTEIQQNLNVETELSIISDILLFYSPRSLVSPLISNRVKIDNEEIFVSGSSEESPHKGFPIVENAHGTFMFYPKYHCLLDELDSLNDIGLDFGRIDTRRFSDIEQKLVYDFLASKITFLNLKEALEKPVIKSFFRSNRSDVLFQKLKNSRLLKDDDSYIGEVVSVEKGYGIGVHVSGKHLLRINDEVSIKTPEGKIVKATIKQLKKWSGENIDQLNHGHAVIQYVKGVAPKSIVLS